MQIKTRGIVFNHFKYSDSSIIVRIYTEELGLKSFMVRGLKSKKSSLRKSLFQPLHLLQLELNYNERKELNTIREVHLAKHFHSIPFDVRKNTIVLFLKEILNLVIKEEESNTTLFNFLFQAIEHLDLRKEKISNFHLAFLIKLTRHLGFFPRDNFTEGCGFNLIEGEFTKAKGSENFVIYEPFSKYVFQLIRIDLSDEELQIPALHRKKLLEYLITFYRHHIPDMREVKSHQVLQQVLD